MDNDKKPPHLVDLAKQRENTEDAARAKRAREFATAVEEAKACRPIILELMALTCQDWFDRYQALQKVGFTKDEALQLCWRRS